MLFIACLILSVMKKRDIQVHVDGLTIMMISGRYDAVLIRKSGTILSCNLHLHSLSNTIVFDTGYQK